MKVLGSGYYTDGYNLEQIRCWDLTRACACGCYNKEFYYMYCFLYAMHRGWFWKSQDTVDDILKQLGLEQKVCKIHSETELLNEIYSAIDDFNPVLLALRYDTIYFNSLYKQDTNLQHCMLITGYDEEKELLNLKDYLLAREFIKNTIPRKVEVFIDYKIKEEYVLDMWRKSKEKGVNSLMVFKEKGEPRLNNYKKLLNYFLQNVQIKNEHYSCYNSMSEIDYKDIWKRLYNSICMMLDVVKRALYKEECFAHIVDKNTYEKEMDVILRNRNACTNVLIKDLMRLGQVREETIENIMTNDNMIIKVIRRIYEQIIDEDTIEENILYNLALNAKVLCDSEGSNALASYAVNGKLNDDSCWLSDYRYEEHWLTVDLGKEQRVNRFIVRHHPFKRNLVTCDFRIEGSSDLQGWEMLTSIKNNEKHENIMDIKPACYRYYRLYIERANVIDENAARIYSFEVYAESQEGET